MVTGTTVAGVQPDTARSRLSVWVQKDFALNVVSLDAVAHGADEAAELWCATCADGTRYAVKLTDGGTPAGLLVTAHLAAHSVAGIAAPLRNRDDRLWSEHEGRRLAVVPWVSDERALNSFMTREHWSAFGALLARVHATRVTAALRQSLPTEAHTHERAVSVVRFVDLSLQSIGEGAGEAEGVADPLIRSLAQGWRAAACIVSTLVEQADDLGCSLRARQARGVVCHGDPHLGNVLIGGDERVWLIDWDDAVLAPRERDLMFVIGGVLAFAPVRPVEQSWFFDGYGEVDLDPTRLAYYRCARALEDLADPAAQVLDTGRHSQSERTEALAIVQGVLSPTGLVNLAMRSLRDLGCC